MTPEAAVAAIRKAGHIVIIHRGQVFFNTSDEKEALKWDERGALLVPHYTEEERQHRARKGKRTVQGWEVHVLGALTRIEVEDTDGDLVDLTKDHLLLAARETVAV